MNITSPANKNSALSESNIADILIDHSIDAIIAIDTDCNVITWNKAAAIMYRINKNAAMGKSIFKLLPGIEEDKEMANAIQHALNGYKSFVPAYKQFAYRTHAENHFIPLKNKDDIVIGVMNIVHDVAHRIKAERQLQQLNEELEKRYRQLQVTSEELASFTYITSNKIKEPLRQIYTGIEHLIQAEAGKLSDAGKASFRRMQSSVNRMDLLLEDILSLAQISILQKPDTLVDLDELLKDVSKTIKRLKEKDANIVIEKLCTIPGHKSYLYLLFYNLLDNALKFNEHEVPEIKITCEEVSLDEKANNPFSETEYYKIGITDNGIGFDAADVEKIFKMFEKLHDKKYKGSGTGLTIARKIMTAHNGFITAESEPGKSTTFYCYFPATDTENNNHKT
jgi:PAS domain S-box-containing protein